MVRSRNTVRLQALSPEDLIPLAAAHGPTLRSALQAIITWGTSRTLRKQVMAGCDFPMPADLPAFLVVNQLVYRGTATPTALADAIDTSQSNMSKTVSRLEAAGLVFRAADPRDDRGVIVGLTPHGRALGHRILRVLGTDDRNLPGWSADELDTLERLVIKFAETIDALPGHPITATAGVAFPRRTEPSERAGEGRPVISWDRRG